MEKKTPSVEVITYGRQLVRFLQGYDILRAKAGWFERGLLWLLQTTYRERLRAIVDLVPSEISNQIFEEAPSSNNSNEQAI